MKKILLVAAIALFGLTANAQEKKETRLIECKPLVFQGLIHGNQNLFVDIC